MSDTATPRFRYSHPPKSNYTLEDSLPPSRMEVILIDILETLDEILDELKHKPKATK